LIGGTSAVLALKLMGAFGGFLFSVWVAREYGDAALGKAELFILWVTVGATLLRVGWDGAVVKMFGSWSSAGRRDWVRDGFQKWTGAMLLVAVVTAIGVPWLLDWASVSRPSLWIGAAMGAWVVIGWLAECLRGTGHVGTYALFQPGWWMLLAGMFMALGFSDPASALGLSSVVMAGVALLFTAWWFRNRYAPHLSEGQDLSPRPTQGMARLAFPIWIGSVLHLVLSWADTAMLSVWMTETDVAHYRAAFRLAALLTFTQFAVNALGAPTFGALHAAGNMEGLRRTVHRIGWMNAAVALPGFLVLWFLGPWLLGLWGASFSQSDAVQALGILAAGQAINALSGPVMYLLNMTGGERVGLVILAVSAACQLTAGAIWIPEFGLVGAASSACFGMVVWNVVSLIWVRKTYGFWMVSLMNGWWRRN
jgi:O-antigen/teichoic acid export membrane protein